MGVVTTTLTLPVPGGVVAVIAVPLITTRLVAATPPKVTSVAPVKPVPVMVTEVPPLEVPDIGEILLKVGPLE